MFIITNNGKDDNLVKVLKHNKLLFILKSFKIIRKEKPNVLHSHSHWYILAPCILYKKFHPETTVVHTFHTEPTKGTHGIKRKVLELLLSKCDVVAFVSKDLEEKTKNYLKIKSPARVIYAGVTIKQVDEAAINMFKDKYDLRGNKPIISFIGPLVWEMKVEGIKRLIEAFAIIKQTYPKAKLIIVGEGEYKKELEDLSERKNLRYSVIFTGFVESAYLPLSVSDIYAHISLQEGLPISLLEAMGVGKPVVASNTGGIPELIRNDMNGIVVEPVPEKIAKEVKDLFKDKERMEKLGLEAKRTVEEDFTWSRTVDEYLQIYNRGASRWRDKSR